MFLFGLNVMLSAKYSVIDFIWSSYSFCVMPLTLPITTKLSMTSLLLTTYSRHPDTFLLPLCLLPFFFHSSSITFNNLSRLHHKILDLSILFLTVNIPSLSTVCVLGTCQAHGISTSLCIRLPGVPGLEVLS